jgi:hypothetical protein
MRRETWGEGGGVGENGGGEGEGGGLPSPGADVGSGASLVPVQLGRGEPIWFSFPQEMLGVETAQQLPLAAALITVTGATGA